MLQDLLKVKIEKFRKSHEIITEFSEICDKPLDKAINVVGVVKHISDVQNIMSRSGQELVKRSITLVDETKHMIQLTVWGNLAKNWSYNLIDILTFKGVEINEYMGYYGIKAFASTIIILDDANRITNVARGLGLDLDRERDLIDLDKKLDLLATESFLDVDIEERDRFLIDPIRDLDLEREGLDRPKRRLEDDLERERLDRSERHLDGDLERERLDRSKRRLESDLEREGLDRPERRLEGDLEREGLDRSERRLEGDLEREKLDRSKRCLIGDLEQEGFDRSERRLEGDLEREGFDRSERRLEGDLDREGLD
ncbi:hypothetical protein TKK_0002525 [Trichogramma kaykai]